MVFNCRQMIWDYEQGVVVCSETGEVMDRIYVAPVVRNEAGCNRSNWRGGARAEAGFRRKLRLFRRYYSLYRRVRRVASRAEKRGIIVDEDAMFQKLLKRENITGTMVHKHTLEMHVEDGDRELIEAGLEYIREHSPVLVAKLTSKSIRARSTIAYVVGAIVKYGTIPPADYVEEVFKISQSSYARLLNEIFSTLPIPNTQ